MAAVIGTLDSASFDWCYEFDANLLSEEDLDLNGVPDFALTGDGGTVANGIWTLSKEEGLSFYNASNADQIWQQSGVTWETGYTIEFRARVSEINGSQRGCNVNAISPSVLGADDNAFAWLNLFSNGESWGALEGNLPTSDAFFAGDNSDAFHIFRIVQEPGIAGNASAFTVWRDGERIAFGLQPGYTNSNYDRLLVGDISTLAGAKTEFDYLRFTPGAYAPVGWDSPSSLQIVDRTITSNRPSLYGAVYAESEGTRMVSVSPGYQSDDNGVTWTACPPDPDFTEGLPYGYRRVPVTSAVDPNNGRLITIVNSLDTPGLDPGAVEPAIALSEYYLRYRVSEDGGRTWLFEEPMVHQGAEYSQQHPFDGIQIGSNAMYLGDKGCIPIISQSGRVLVPVQATMLDTAGNLWNPTGQTTYTEVFVGLGAWQQDGTLSWTASERVSADPSTSTRGMIEPTLAQFSDGRLLMVMRGSNAGNTSLPGYRWFSVSDDDGEAWTDPQPWRYDDGQSFFSPSSMSTLITHSSGRVFWVGNLTSQNPNGNLPRYPVVMGEVDPESLMLIHDSVIVVDSITEDDLDQGRLDLCHFSILEDRLTQEFVLTYPRYHDSYSYCEWATVRLAIPESQIPGDANGDGKVDGSDVTILAGNWQAGVGDPDPDTITWAMGDFNGDGQIDGSDVTILAGNWQYGVEAAATSAPEPSTLLLLTFVLLGFGWVKHKRGVVK